MADPWRISLHGGHSGEFCEHAEGTLRGVVEAAVAAGFATFGLSEHAPRGQDRFLYSSERQKGFTTGRLQTDFDAYVAEARALAAEFSDRIQILVGFEAEVVPAASYADEMSAIREKYALEYMVGSVHYVGEIQIDGTIEEFQAAGAASGGIESLAVCYYDTVAEMVARLRPEVVGHLDLIRRNAPVRADLQTTAIAAAADRALQSVKESGAILDLNTAGWRKGLDNAYPEPWLIRRAHELGIGFCFGDDSHAPAQVGDGIDRAREYLLELDVTSIRSLDRRQGGVVSTVVRLS
ncbi:MAG: histidinol-phosphatase [Acidobacteria bacterium]|nr:histidinol-phosphatase [Acidobacteriota bacterium]MDA1235854.1 histidinol-phosphatase [Acidobacteriota bacterium]